MEETRRYSVVFMWQIEQYMNCNRITLINIVYSDKFPTYKHLSATFVHKSFNHSEHFTDLEGPSNNINGLEGSHCALRKKLQTIYFF